MGGTRDGQFARVAVLVILVLAVGCVVGVASVAGADGEAATGVADGDSVSPADDDEGDEGGTDATLTVRPVDETVSAGSNTTLEIVVQNATTGISTYEFAVELNSSAASFLDYELKAPPTDGPGPLDKSGIGEDNSTLVLETALLDAKHAAGEETVLAEATIAVEELGPIQAMPVVSDDGFVINRPGYKYDIEQTPGVVEGVNKPPTAALSATPPTVQTGTETTLDASGSTDPDDATSALDYTWRVTSQPAGAEAPTPAGSGGSVTLSTPGEYVYEVTVSDGEKQDTATTTVSVISGPPAIIQHPPKDHDNDGNHEDVRGDGETNIFDVQALFKNLDNPDVQDNAGSFDFHGSSPDKVTVFDVQQLFIQLD